MGGGWIGVSGAVGCASRAALMELSCLQLLHRQVLYEWVGGLRWDVDCRGVDRKINVVIFIVIRQGTMIVGGGRW